MALFTFAALVYHENGIRHGVAGVDSQVARRLTMVRMLPLDARCSQLGKVSCLII